MQGGGGAGVQSAAGLEAAACSTVAFSATRVDSAACHNFRFARASKQTYQYTYTPLNIHTTLTCFITATGTCLRYTMRHKWSAAVDTTAKCHAADRGLN